VLMLPLGRIERRSAIDQVLALAVSRESIS
jgi:hypothetical protein